uniref:Secreted phosphoprotein 1 n=1 Tax=Lepisosteus oculatus TaxID=7918 RepID=A0A109UTX9_LEPOC|nr:secreted phosphoprotein 1 [Lepisosteus oculatus]
MKTSFLLFFLLGTVYCLPMRRSFSRMKQDSSEEQQVLTAGSDESSDSSTEGQKPEVASNESADTTDSTDTDEDNDTEEADESDESDSAEDLTTAGTFTAEPPFTSEPTVPPFVPTGRGDARGDSIGYYDDSYRKSMEYLKSNKIEKGPMYYDAEKMEKSMNLISKNTVGGKQKPIKSLHTNIEENAIEKDLKVFKALRMTDDLLDEDTSTPEVESQGLDAPGGPPKERQAPGPQSSEESSQTRSTESVEGTDSPSNEAQSSEESTASPAVDSNSDETSESEESVSAGDVNQGGERPLEVK